MHLLSFNSFTFLLSIVTSLSFFSIYSLKLSIKAMFDCYLLLYFNFNSCFLQLKLLIATLFTMVLLFDSFLLTDFISGILVFREGKRGIFVFVRINMLLQGFGVFLADWVCVEWRINSTGCWYFGWQEFPHWWHRFP